MWNLWHGCHRVSEGCRLCYVYRQDALWGNDSSQVRLTSQFRLPAQLDRRGRYRIAAGTVVYTCFTSDFFIPEADAWRTEAWRMIRQRHDLRFIIITKRIERFSISLPDDWGGGYDNVTICATCENQRRADQRMPLLMALPARHKVAVCEPLLEPVDLTPYLGSGEIEAVWAGGESGSDAVACDFEWVKSLRRQCDAAGIGFHYHQTGARLVKDGRIYRIRRDMQHSLAKKADLDTV